MPRHYRNYPYIGPRRSVPVRGAPFFSPFFDEEEIAPARQRQPAEPEKRSPAPKRETVQPPVESEQEPEVKAKPQQEEPDWKETALRLQAEMDNFRKRQTRRADEAITTERERLLNRLLPLADNMARAMAHSQAGEQSLRRGVELIQRELLRLLEAEGVTRIEALGQPFDPTVHEALATREDEAETDTVITEIEPGYKLGDKLLRPARVVVAA